MTREWPWGMVLLEDDVEARAQSLPSDFDDRGLAIGESILAVQILHGIDGEATAEIWRGSLEWDLLELQVVRFVAISGRIVMGDAAREETVSVTLGRGDHELRVLVDEIGSPSRVVFELPRDALR